MTPRPNSPAAWFLAARPKTLAAALAPVVVASALAWADGAFKAVPVVLCLVFAMLMQVAANFINDLFDFLKGTDRADRLGPERAVAQGWIATRGMKRGIAVVLALAAADGLALLYHIYIHTAGAHSTTVAYSLLALGAACVAGAFLYTTLLSYIALGDVLVLLFFGFVPVCGTYFAQCGTLTPAVWTCAAAMGLATDTLLVVNNYRDRDTDRLSGKRTLVSVLGESFGRWFYFALGTAATALALLAGRMGHGGASLAVFYMYFHLTTWGLLSRLRQGRQLNAVLGLTARNILIFGLLLAAGIALGL
ncbi:MAG: 1,4-dihydroxy-2-naphthoate octaprenyltransferase [Bacteroidaceae bacterium]|nr:1,4-dihydroxy-2-naphthoate octaprenyltransferase [Bacteroidaceae bacterium]